MTRLSPRNISSERGESHRSVVRAWMLAVFGARVGYELKDRFVRALHRKSARFFLRFLPRPGQGVPVDGQGRPAQVVVPLAFNPAPYLPALQGRVDREVAAQSLQLLYVPRAFPSAPIEGFPMSAILMPRVTGRRAARVVEASKAAALSALAPSTILQRRPPQREALEHLARLVERMPAYVLEVGDAGTIPDAILEVLV